MKLYFAAVAAAALFASTSAFAAVSVAGRSESEDCFRAAAAQSRGAMSEIALGKALAHCNAALAGDMSQNDRAGTLVNRGMLQAAAGNQDAAIADYSAALARNPDMAEGYMNRGAALLRASRYQEARADFDRALELGTANAHIAYFNRGEAEEASGNLVAAYHDYRRAQEMAPNFKAASLELARFHVSDHRIAQSR
jgi:tetratricopeptide (TPR) repeat protein